MDVETTLHLTSPSHDVTRMSSSFIYGVVEITLEAPDDFFGSEIGDPDNYGNDIKNFPAEIFVGMKSANELLQRYEIFCANRDTGCKNNEGVREAYAYSTFMSNEEKQRARYTHSLYENVHNYDYSICGTTFKYSDFLANFDGGIKNKQVTQTVEFNLPDNDILPLSGINFFPNGVI
jgi:hypothetical protein